MLPELNRNVLEYLLEFLVAYSNNSETTKMTSSNLAIILGPTLLKPCSTDEEEHGLSRQLFMDTAFAAAATKSMIEEFDFLLRVRILSLTLFLSLCVSPRTLSLFVFLSLLFLY